MSFNKVQTLVSTYPHFFLSFVSTFFPFYTTTYFNPFFFSCLSFFFQIAYFIINLSLPFLLLLPLVFLFKKPRICFGFSPSPPSRVLHPDPIRMVASALEDDLCGQPKSCVAAVRFSLRPEITQGSPVIRSPLSYMRYKKFSNFVA
jgi:hypothetical protein